MASMPATVRASFISSTRQHPFIWQGLRIAPPEAPVTGYMFDKGVYFADMVRLMRSM